MTRYIANEVNLKMMMNLLRDKSKNIQFEAFHVFKASVICFAMTCSGAEGDC
jgi:calcium binding protein 39